MGKNRSKKGRKQPLPAKAKNTLDGKQLLQDFPDPADEIEELEISSDDSPSTTPQWPFRDHAGLVDFLKNNHFASSFQDDPDIQRVRREYMEVLNQCHEANPEQSTAQIKSIIEFYENEMNKVKMDGFSDEEQRASAPLELLEKLEKLDMDILDKDGALPSDLTDDMCIMIKEKLKLTNEDLEILKEFKMAMEQNSFIKVLAENNRLVDLDQRISDKIRGITVAALTRIQQSGEKFPSTATQDGLLNSDGRYDFGANVIIHSRKNSRRVNGEKNEEISNHILSTGCASCRQYPTKIVFQITLVKPFCPDTMWNALLGLPSKDLKLNRRKTSVQYIRIVQFATNEDRHNRGSCDLEAYVLDFVNPEELDSYFRAMAESLGFIHRVQMGNDCDDVWHCRVQLSARPYPWRKVDYATLAMEIGEQENAYFKAFKDVICPLSINTFLETTMLNKRGYVRLGHVVQPFEDMVDASREDQTLDPSGSAAVPESSSADVPESSSADVPESSSADVPESSSADVPESSAAHETARIEDEGELQDIIDLFDLTFETDLDDDDDDDQGLIYNPSLNIGLPGSRFAY